jgi:hypothetical protein
MKGFAWSDLGPDDIEELLAALLVEMHPGATRVDGSGGDGGRDVIWETGPHGLEIFEIKSFTGRLTPKQRGQVEKSLTKALGHEPVRWHLVVPLNHAPAEHRWFNTLRKSSSVPLTWFGRTAIENELSRRRHLLVGYVQSVRETALDAVAQYGAEKALLTGGAPDLLERVQGLQGIASECDPDYELRFASEPGRTVIGLHARTEDATTRRPITGSFKLRSADDSDEEGRAALEEFRRFLAYGTPAELPPHLVLEASMDAPLGMGFAYRAEEGTGVVGSVAEGFSGPPSIQVFPTKENASWSAPGRISVLDPRSKVLHTVPVEWCGRNGGAVGGEMRGRDRLGRFEFTVRFDWPVDGSETNAVQLDMRFTPSADVTPSEMLGALRFAETLGEPNRIDFFVERSRLFAVFGAPAGGIRPGSLADAVEDLACIEGALGTFTLPDELDGPQGATVFDAARLIREESYPVDIDEVHMCVHLSSPEQFLAGIRPGEPGAYGIRQTLDLSFLAPGFGVERFLSVDACLKESYEELEAQATAGGPVDLTLSAVPGTGRVTLVGLHDDLPS